MNTEQPIIPISPPPVNQSAFQKLRAFLRTSLERWLILPLWQRVATIITVCLLVGGIVFAGWWFMGRPSASTAETQTPQGEFSDATSDPPATDQSTEQPAGQPPEPTPGGTGSPSGGNGSGGGSGGGGSGGGGGGSDAGFPNASTTGPSGCCSYTQHSGTFNVTVDGTVLNCIELNGVLTINASNVTVQNSILREIRGGACASATLMPAQQTLSCYGADSILRRA